MYSNRINDFEPFAVGDIVMDGTELSIKTGDQNSWTTIGNTVSGLDHTRPDSLTLKEGTDLIMEGPEGPVKLSYEVLQRMIEMVQEKYPEDLL